MLNLIAPINQLGYGVVGQNLTRVLLDTWIQPINPQTISCEPQYTDIIREKLQERDFYYNAPCIKVWHQHDMTGFTGGLKIGFPIFELDKFTDKEKYHLNYCDRLFVCSEWAKTVCEQELDNPDVRVVPLGVDREIFYPKNKTYDQTIFLTVGKWEKRKGHEEIILAFNKAFTEKDDVHLAMVCDNPFLSKEEEMYWHALISDSRLRTKISLLPRQNTQVDIASLMNRSTCGVFPARAEGWNLELLEMMACNKPVITTNYSGHTQFCNNDNALLIDFDNFETASDGKFFTSNIGNWGAFEQKQIDQLCEYMRYVHNNNIQDNPAGLETAKNFTWENTSKKILENVS